MRYINPYNQEIRVNKYDTWDYPVCVNTFACINDRKHLPIKLSNYNYDFDHLKPFKFMTSDSLFDWSIVSAVFEDKVDKTAGIYHFRYRKPAAVGNYDWYLTTGTITEQSAWTQVTLSEYGITVESLPYEGVTLSVKYSHPYTFGDAVYFNVFDYNSSEPLVSKKIDLALGKMSARTPDYVDGEGYIMLYTNRDCPWMYDEEGNLVINLLPEDFSPCEIDDYEYSIVLNCKAPSPISDTTMVNRRITLVERAPLILYGSNSPIW